MSDDEELVMIAAVRYALGRRTYVVNGVVRHVANNAFRLPVDMMRGIVRDIREAESLGDEVDKRRWMELVAILNHRIGLADAQEMG